MFIFNSIPLRTADRARAALFYDQVLGVLRFERLPTAPEKPFVYERSGAIPTICICTAKSDSSSPPQKIGVADLIAETRAQVRAFHECALMHGGASEGAPGPCADGGPDCYAADIRDPDGNKLHAVCYAAA